MFAFSLETCNNQDFAEAYAAGFYDVNRLRSGWDGDLTLEEVEIERKNVIFFDKLCGNLFMNMRKKISENYEGDARTYIDKGDHEVVSSQRIY